MGRKKYGIIIVFIIWMILTLGLWFLPKDDFSEAERRKLESVPKLTMENILNGEYVKDLENYSLDHFPLRQFFRTIKSVFHYNVLKQNDNNDIYIYDGYAVKMEYPLKEKSIDASIKKIDKIYERYLKNANTKNYFTIVPDKNYFLADESGHLKYNYDILFEKIEEMPWNEYIDILPTLKIDSYYKTDTHWKQEELLQTSRVILESMGSTAFTKDEVNLNECFEEFQGVYYGQAALPMRPDTIKYFTNSIIDDATVFDYETNKTVEIYDVDLTDNRDKYDLFLHGAKSLLKIENKKAKTEKELIVFRDSFGSSIIPLLIKDYRTVTIVDIRYVQSSILNQFVDFQDKDVLFLYSPLVLNNSTILK